MRFRDDRPDDRVPLRRRVLDVRRSGRSFAVVSDDIVRRSRRLLFVQRLAEEILRTVLAEQLREMGERAVGGNLVVLGLFR